MPSPISKNVENYGFNCQICLDLQKANVKDTYRKKCDGWCPRHFMKWLLSQRKEGNNA